ncbi:MAG: toll/interleukin-1 receptor domain-containing protein [Terracidiphilus sp.]
MPFDVFISHASEDRIVANAVCARLESAGIRCWIAPRDIVAGTSYGEAIIEAIHTVKVMVLVFSSNANSSGQVPKEVERAVSNGLVILPFRIEDVAPGKSLDYFIGSIHWLDAMTPPLEKHLDDLVETVRKLLPSPAGAQAVPVPPPPAAQPPAGRPVAAAGTRSAIPSKTLWIGAVAALVIAAVIWGVIQFRPKPGAATGPPVPVVNPSTNPPAVIGSPGPATGPTAAAGADPIVGCYHWFNNAAVVIHPNGIIVGGPFTGHWRSINAALRAYQLNWPEASKPVFPVTISPDQRSFSGINQYQYPISATRTAGTAGLVGSWILSNNVPMFVYPTGTFTSATFTGAWRTIDASSGVYSLTWPPLIDSVTLSPDAQQITGANQYGVAVSGTRTEPCSVN